ncbi:hypothetical protein [Hyphomicrobium sp.]|uniref:hypothetical protein n=1 Tax=Hyphomicrobium sp. TaxID=82 RepID=UPI002FE37013
MSRAKGDGQALRVFASKKNVPSRSLTERIERALVLAAYIVVRHGPVYAPIVARLERELEVARRTDPTEQAKRILATYGAEYFASPPRGTATRERTLRPSCATPVRSESPDGSGERSRKRSIER